MGKKKEKEKNGLIIGKFAPLHKGHEYLIKKALNQVDKLYIFIYETDLIDINIEAREAWIKNVFKNDKIETIKAINPPKKYGMDEESVKIQLEYISKILGENNICGITHVFSSEEYGKCIAQMLNAENVLVDKERVNIPVNATCIREDLEKYKKYLSKEVYEELKSE